MTVIASVVEGHGETTALPILIRRILAKSNRFDVEVTTPHRVPKSQMRPGGKLAAAVSLQANRVEVAGGGGVIVLLDADKDDPEELRQTVLEACGGRAPSVVIAVKEYEAWFLGSLGIFAPSS